LIPLINPPFHSQLVSLVTIHFSSSVISSCTRATTMAPRTRAQKRNPALRSALAYHIKAHRATQKVKRRWRGLVPVYVDVCKHNDIIALPAITAYLIETKREYRKAVEEARYAALCVADARRAQLDCTQ
jgi:hypothetical protein